MKEKYFIYVISDSLGHTGERIAYATAEQFEASVYTIKKFPYLVDKEMAKHVIEEAASQPSIVIITSVLPEYKAFVLDLCRQKGVRCIDIMKPLISEFEQFLGEAPKRVPGITHKLDDNYYKRIEAVEFAVKYDDGKDPRGVKKADIVIIGISRTSKTPLSMYLAHQNYRVANIPLVPGIPVPQELREIDSRRIIGLTTDPVKLNAVRQERLKAMGLTASASYASMPRIYEELDYAKTIMSQLGCPVIDVSNRAIEETANMIIDYIGLI